MKAFIILLSMCFTTLPGLAQFDSESVITSTAQTVFDMYAADLDGDNDVDLLYAGVEDDKIIWFENTDGLGNFDTGSEIDTEDGAAAVFAADLDGDNDLDVISGSRDSGRLLWYENLDGAGSFGAEQVVDTGVLATFFVGAYDLDGDNDLDIVSVSSNQNRIVWYENLDGQGTFGTDNFIATTPSSADMVQLAVGDLDGDNDNDIAAVLGGLNQDDQLIWVENTDGQGSYGPVNEILVDGGRFSNDLALGDIDNDNDLDIVVVFGVDTQVGWFENTDGQGAFGPLNTITSTGSNTRSLVVNDINGDAFVDIVVVSNSNNSVTYFENTAGTFSSGQEVTTTLDTAFFVTAADLNGDSKTDIVVASHNDDTVAWYTNVFPLATEDFNAPHVSVSPNPTSSLLRIETDLQISTISLFNVLGEQILTSEDQNSIDISGFASGIYILEIRSEDGRKFNRKVIKQ